MDILKNIWAKIANEPLVVFALVIAALNATTDQTWQGYLVAAITALLRFVTTGPSTAAALKARIPPAPGTDPAEIDKPAQ